MALAGKRSLRRISDEIGAAMWGSIRNSILLRGNVQPVIFHLYQRFPTVGSHDMSRKTIIFKNSAYV
jgi:hypothetical protein